MHLLIIGGSDAGISAARRARELKPTKHPAKPLDPAILEFAKYIVSRDGQTETVKSGFYPITGALRATALSKLGIPNDPN